MNSLYKNKLLSIFLIVILSSCDQSLKMNAKASDDADSSYRKERVKDEVYGTSR